MLLPEPKLKVRVSDSMRVMRMYCEYSLARPSFITRNRVLPMVGSSEPTRWKSWMLRWPAMWFSSKKPFHIEPLLR